MPCNFSFLCITKAFRQRITEFCRSLRHHEAVPADFLTLTNPFLTYIPVLGRDDHGHILYKLIVYDRWFIVKDKATIIEDGPQV